MNKLILKEGRERSLLHGHHWLFSGAVQRVEGNPQPGTIAEQETVDEAFFARRIQTAVQLRESLSSCRLNSLSSTASCSSRCLRRRSSGVL
uniref:hypothetical protein n=1 Tax=Candidatus Electronema sp. TaxID=2698783 RepID=UPI0040564207